MKFLTKNVAGLNQYHRLHQTLRQARQHDITFLQETKLKTSQASFIRNKWGSNNIFMACVGSARRGVLTLVHPRLNPTYLHEISDPNGQFHLLVALLQGETYLLVNVYGNPDSDRQAENTMGAILANMDNVVAAFTIRHIVMAGDFNFVLSPTDTTSSSRKPRAEAVCSTIIETHDLYDAAALQSPTPMYTYFRHRAENTHARYDRFYVTPLLLNGVKIQLLPRTGDHAPVQLSSNDTNIPKTWKFSDEILSDPVFCQGLHNCVRESLSEFTENVGGTIIQMQTSINYDNHPCPQVLTSVVRKVRKFCMEETRKRAALRRRKEQELIEKLVSAREELNAQPADEALVRNLEFAQQALAAAQTTRSQAASTINHINYSGFGERTSRYHFQRSGRGRPSREIPKLVINTPEGSQTLEGSEVPTFMFEKYADIVKEDPIAGTMSIQEFLGHELFGSLRLCPEEDQRLLTAPVQPMEIKSIIKNLKSVSAPGPLGISNNLLKELAPYILEILVKFGNQLFFDDDLPDIDPFFFHRHVIFILKPGKNPLDPDSYRGLSLLENLFKIFSKILANRMLRPLSHIQHPQQFGFTRGKGCLEASRCVLDTIQHAKRHNNPLIVISTDFKKAFDSISLDHVERCLEIYGFPFEFIRATMRLVRSGTMQFQVNSSTSEDHELLAGSGQGDPKSSGIFNVSAAPLNHYLANSPEVPRYEIGDGEVAPVFYADDDLTLLQGDKVDLILAMLQKIQMYRRVSGLFLNLPKCEIMAINCNHEDIRRIVNETGMKKVNSIRHLGLIINEDGELTHEANIAPIQNAMDRIADSLSTNSSTPLGRAIYAKFLLASRYLHKIQNFDFTEVQIQDLRKAVLRLTWTRHRMGTDSSSTRVHIANGRVAQPYGYGGLSLPDPQIQYQALKLCWARKFSRVNTQVIWSRILEEMLREKGRPTISQHLVLGFHEWKITGDALDASPFWAKVFHTIANLIYLSHEFDRCWALVPLTGYEQSDFSIIDISTLSYRNPNVKRIVDAGLINIGQVFLANDLGHVDGSRLKDFDDLEQEYGVNITLPVRNSIIGLANQIKRRYRGSQSFAQSSMTTIQSLLATRKSGGHEATRLLLRQQRNGWEWGDYPRSFSTYSRDHLINLSAFEFSRAFYHIRGSSLPPSTQWTSFQVMLRTLWTNVKESGTLRNLTSENPIGQWCSNCHLLPEHTVHLIYQCHIAAAAWEEVESSFNEVALLLRQDFVPIQFGRDNIMFNVPPQGLSSNERRDFIDIVMLVKHVLYRLKFRHDPNSIPSVRRVLVVLCIDLEKAVLVRNFLGKNSHMLQRFLASVQTRAGF